MGKVTEAVTSWIRSVVKPIRVGWYEVMRADGTLRRKLWDGVTWRRNDHGDLVPIDLHADAQWRGLAAPAGMRRVGYTVRRVRDEGTVHVERSRIPRGVRVVYVPS